MERDACWKGARHGRVALMGNSRKDTPEEAPEGFEPQPTPSEATHQLPESPVPLYYRIYVELCDRIYSGQIAQGELVPGEVDLAKEFGVSRITAQRALNELAAAKLVVRERGRGTRVVHQLSAPSVITTMDGWLENISLMALRTDARVIEFDYVQANQEVASALQIDVGASVQRAVRSRHFRGESISYLITFLPEQIGRKFQREDLARYPLLHLLERAGYRVASARQLVSATVAAPSVAAALGIDIGAPLLEVRRIVYDITKQPIEYIRVLYRPDRYRYEMELVRVRKGDGMRWVAGPGPEETGDLEAAAVAPADCETPDSHDAEMTAGSGKLGPE